MNHDLSRPAAGATQAPRACLRRLGAFAFACALGLSACGGGGSSSGDMTGDGGTGMTSPAVPVLTTTTIAATVVMPAGLALTADKLSIVTSLGKATPSPSGAVTLAVYADNGVQLAIARNAAGNPMMMGWIDATHTTISAATTADVYAYFALGGAQVLSGADALALVASIPTAGGITALEGTVEHVLAANADALATPNATVHAAIAAFAQPLYSNSHNSPMGAGRAHVQGILIDPPNQSGITVLQDPPFAAHLTNSYRRRAYAFVDRVSHTTQGVIVADPAAVTAFEVPPVIGVNGGVTGAITDIMNAYYGTQQTAYAAVTAPDSGSFPVALVGGSDKTTFQVTVVGPGASAGVSGSLTAEQTAALNDVAIRGFVKDFMAPTLANAILGSGVIDFSAGQSTAKGKFLSALLTNVTTDFAALVPTIPGLADKISKGQWFDAGTDIANSASGSATIRMIFINAFEAASGAGFNVDATTEILKSFDLIMNAAGGILQVYDSTVYVKDLAYSDRADQFSIVVNASKVELNPSQSTIDVGGTTTLTASVLGVDDLTGYSFHWTTTTTFGDLNEVAGGGRVHQSDYCSSSSQAVFVYETSAADGAADTVSVDAYSGSNCDPAKGDKLGTGSATVKLQRGNDYTLYGGPGGYDCGATSAGGNVFNDDSLAVFLNGVEVFRTPYSGCGGVSPIVLPGAKKGDTVRLVLSDEGGHHAGLSGLYLLHDNEYVQVDPGFNIATPDGMDNGVQYDHSFAIPF